MNKTNPNTGLTSAEAHQRTEQGLSNGDMDVKTKSVKPQERAVYDDYFL